MLKWDVSADFVHDPSIKTAQMFFAQHLRATPTKMLFPVRVCLLPDGHAMHGICVYPSRYRAFYRITCFLTPRFPQYVVNDLVRGAFDSGYTIIRNHGEALAWMLAHELGHYARHANIVNERNTEDNANKDAHCALRLYRVYCSGEEHS